MNTHVAPENFPGLLSRRAHVVWRSIQTAVWLIGVAILLALWLQPELGIHAFWNVLIPVAPALLVVAPGVWRNVCPLGSTALFARHMGLSAERRLTRTAQGWLGLIAVVALLAIVPLRHVVLDLDGPATALTIAALAIVAIAMGLRYQWKSGWCSGLCPVHPVEKLYGHKAAVSVPNAHCDTCHRCVSPCAESTPAIHPLTVERGLVERVTGVLMVGGFAGFIWGWFQVPDYAGAEGWAHLAQAYGYPLGGLAATVALYLVLERLVPRERRLVLVRAFAAAAVACYYWFRLPMLFGFTHLSGHPADGRLVDLRGVLPAWSPTAFHLVTTAAFLWWFLAKSSKKRAWEIRPDFAT